MTILKLILFVPLLQNFLYLYIQYLIFFLFRMDLPLNYQVLREKIKEGKLKERKVCL